MAKRRGTTLIWKTFRTIHQITGAFLALLMLVWFLSGIVMIYHTFPRANQNSLISKQSSLTTNILSPDSILEVLGDTVKISSLKLSNKFGRPEYEIKVGRKELTYHSDDLSVAPNFNDSILFSTIKLWCNSPIEKIDTIYDVDQWIPFGYLKEEMPILKIYFKNDTEDQLYINPLTGKVYQFTDKTNRFWAYVGAIPHWIYFTQLRERQDLWSMVVKWCAGIACGMCLIGFFVAIPVWWKQRKNRGLFSSPYRKRWYKWHFISGLFFGLFAITFAFSGLMSMIDMPDWMKKRDPDQNEQKSDERSFRRNRRLGEMASLDQYKLDIKKIIENKGDSLKAISWLSWNGYPYYKLDYPNSSINIDASSEDINRFILTEGMILEQVKKNGKKDFTIELIKEFDKDYFSGRKHQVNLPVYRVTYNDYLHSIDYYDPISLREQRVDDNTRRRNFLYSGLHSLRFKFLMDHPILWNIVMYTLLIGGIFLSITGIVLTIKLIYRKLKIKNISNKRLLK